MKTLSDKVVCITGAGSGIGRATASRCAKLGARLALSDVDEAGLAETAKECRDAGAKVLTQRVDVSDRAQVEGWAAAVVAHYGSAHVIINNAGVAVAGFVEDLRYEDFEWLMGVNFWGVVHGTKAFLPHLKAAGEGHIVNLSSVFGLIGVPTQGAYNASKFAVRGFSEALRMELEIEGCGVGVTTVHPGGVKTNIARRARLTERKGFVEAASAGEFEKQFRTTAERAAEDVVDAILSDRRRQLIGLDARFIDLFQRSMPELYQWFLVRGARRRKEKLLAASTDGRKSGSPSQ